MEQKKAQRQAVYDQIEDYLDNMPLEETLFRQYLTTQSRFPMCSVNNAILIAAQKPEATQYKTYEDWNKDGFSVLKGQQGFSLLIPNGTYQKADGSTGTNIALQRFFDVSQTTAQLQPEPQDISLNLKALLMRPVCPVKVVDQQKGAVYVAQENRVEIGRGLEKEGAFRLLSLALAHGALAKSDQDYKPGLPKNSFYARCISFLLCSHYSVETSGYSFLDLPNALGNCNNQELRQHLMHIRTTALVLLDRTEKARKDILEHTHPAHDIR
jgi:hypothetical protein